MRKRLAAILSVAMIAALATTLISGDGTEQLGSPGIGIATGTDVVTAGTGMLTQPGTIDITIPGGASVEQVLLYWEGQHQGAAGDDAISVDGNGVTGTLIGGPTTFFRDVNSSTYRADITGLGLVSPGANSISITDMAFDLHNNGAGILAVIDDGTSQSIELRDGNDLAFINFDPTLDTTVAQTYNFAAAGTDRTATLDMFFSSVAGNASGGGSERPSSIEVTSGGVTTIFSDLLDSVDGQEWDTVEISANVPAGATSLTVQALSRDDNATGNRPASFAWNAAALTLPDVPPTPTPTPPPPTPTSTPPPPTPTPTATPPAGGEGCTPGYWKQMQHFDSWVDYEPGDDYETTFEVDASFTKTLLGALKQGGGKEKALGRHATAALLNAAAGGVDYEFSESEVIQLVQDAYASGNFNHYKDMLADENESGCGLN